MDILKFFRRKPKGIVQEIVNVQFKAPLGTHLERKWYIRYIAKGIKKYHKTKNGYCLNPEYERLVNGSFPFHKREVKVIHKEVIPDAVAEEA